MVDTDDGSVEFEPQPSEDSLRQALIDFVLAETGVDKNDLFGSETYINDASGPSRRIEDSYGALLPLEYAFTLCHGETYNGERNAFAQLTIGNDDAYLQLTADQTELTVTVTGESEYCELAVADNLAYIEMLLNCAKRAVNPNAEPQHFEPAQVHHDIVTSLGLDPDKLPTPDQCQPALLLKEIYKVPGFSGLANILPYFSLSVMYAPSDETPAGTICYAQLALESPRGTTGIEMILTPNEINDLMFGDDTILDQSDLDVRRAERQLVDMFYDSQNDDSFKLLATETDPTDDDLWDELRLAE